MMGMSGSLAAEIAKHTCHNTLYCYRPGARVKLKTTLLMGTQKLQWENCGPQKLLATPQLWVSDAGTTTLVRLERILPRRSTI